MQPARVTFAGYLQLVRSNHNFRRLWLAQIVSEIGDWFYSVAIFSFLLVSWFSFKLYLCLAVIVLMIAMNLRGVKESVLVLLPIFLPFVVRHAVLVIYAFLSRTAQLPAIARDAIEQVHEGFNTLGP